MLRYLVRSRRLRLAVITACLPYVLMALLVESLHGAQPSDLVGLAPAAQTASLSAGPVTPPHAPYVCPVCAWMRIGTRQVQQTSLAGASDAVLLLVPPHIADWPDSPVPHPTAFRGPPSVA